MSRSVAPLNPRRLMSSLAASAIVAWPMVACGGAMAAESFSKADIFFELNATDRDLGVHVALDAEGWRDLRIDGPGGRRLIEVSPRGSLGQIGLTELFFEGEEPSLEEVPFSRFLTLVPPGIYQFRATTTEDNQALFSTDRLTAEIPCPVTLTSPLANAPVAVDAVTVRWRPAPGAYNPDTQRCNTGPNIGLVGYQVIIDISNEGRRISRKLLADLPPSATVFRVPAVFLDAAARLPGTQFKLEVLAIEDSGNKTIVEQPFRVAPPTGHIAAVEAGN